MRNISVKLFNFLFHYSQIDRDNENFKFSNAVTSQRQAPGDNQRMNALRQGPK